MNNLLIWAVFALLGFAADYQGVCGDESYDQVMAAIQQLQAYLGKDQKPTTTSAPVVPALASDAFYLKKLDDLTGRVKAIKNYLINEKKADQQLRKKSNLVIEQMKSLVGDTEQVILDLQDDVKDTLTEFEGKIVDVNKTAHIKVNSAGAVLYGGIGSACSMKNGECITEDSECRGGKCQCVAGFSFDRQSRDCKAVCDSYGDSYQSTERYIIRGHNDLTLEKSSLQDCVTRCSTENSFVCRSFDYFPRWRTCYLSSKVKSEVPPEAWEYNSEGYHFQRDCSF